MGLVSRLLVGLPKLGDVVATGAGGRHEEEQQRNVIKSADMMGPRRMIKWRRYGRNVLEDKK